jgi:hypothetical protein
LVTTPSDTHRVIELIQTDWKHLFEYADASDNEEDTNQHKTYIRVHTYVQSIWRMDIPHRQVLKWAVESELFDHPVSKFHYPALEILFEIAAECLIAEELPLIADMIANAMHTYIYQYFAEPIPTEDVDPFGDLEHAELYMVASLASLFRMSVKLVGLSTMMDALNMVWDEVREAPYVFRPEEDRTPIVWAAVKYLFLL